MGLPPNEQNELAKQRVALLRTFRDITNKLPNSLVSCLMHKGNCLGDFRVGSRLSANGKLGEEMEVSSTRPLKKPAIDTDEWIANQKRKYGGRNGLNAGLFKAAKAFNRELKGIKGHVLNELLSIAPQMVPRDFWGADLGWRSRKAQDRWAKLLGRNRIAIAPDQTGLLVKFYMNAADWVPHPYVPPTWALTSYSNFSTYIIPNEYLFQLCHTWQEENSIVLTSKLSDRLRKFGVSLSARYKCSEGIDYAEVAFQYPSNSLAFDVATVWKGETTLAQLVRSIFPDARREYTAEWLQGQRIDIFVPSRNLAFEYHGEQHYRPIEFFGGELGHNATVERDARKRTACRKAGVVLIEWNHRDPISKDLLIAKIKQCGVRMGQASSINEGGV
jgi:hypothetical protein